MMDNSFKLVVSKMTKKDQQSIVLHFQKYDIHHKVVIYSKSHSVGALDLACNFLLRFVKLSNLKNSDNITMQGNSIIVYKGVVHPQLCDVMGHMTTRHYIAMFDDASYHLLYNVFGWSGIQATKDNRGWADVKHVIEYKSEVAAGDLLEIRACLTKLGTKSIAVNYSMFNLANSVLVATLESTSVYFDTLNRKAIPLTNEMKSAVK